MKPSRAPTGLAPLSRRRVLCAVLASGLGGGVGRVQANEGRVEAEYRIKAAFLCRFGQYVEWPAAAPGEGEFCIGVVADEAVVGIVQRVARGQSVQGRAITVRPLGGGDALDGLNVVFVAGSRAARLGPLLDAARGRPILTVCDAGAGEAQAMVTFVVVDDKVKFDIALPPAERSQLKISARLLDVARQVKGRAL